MPHTKILSRQRLNIAGDHRLSYINRKRARQSGTNRTRISGSFLLNKSPLKRIERKVAENDRSCSAGRGGPV